MTTLAMRCQAWGEMVLAEKKIKKDGLVIKTKSGNLIQNPYVGIRNRNREFVAKCDAEFGMTPSSRSRVKAPQPREKNKWSNLG